MKVIEEEVTREQVIRFYVAYDLRKKGRPLINLDEWLWDHPDSLDQALSNHRLKEGVLAAYRTWNLVEFGVADLLACAVFNGIFPGEPQALCQLVLLGKLAAWQPDRVTEWSRPIADGAQLDASTALIARPRVSSEAPAKWYLEDGSGRGIALLQRILRFGEVDRTVYAYLGHEPDERSAFIRSRPELKSIRPTA